MIITSGLRNHLLATFPINEFAFLIDPSCIPDLTRKPYEDILQLAVDLRFASPTVKVNLVVPLSLADELTTNIVTRLHPILLSLDEIGLPESFIPSTSIQTEMRNNLLGSSKESAHARRVLALADQGKMDAVITTSAILIESRYAIYQHHSIRIVPLDEFADLMEVCAHGHSIFWATSNNQMPLSFDLFYPVSHWKNARLATWWRKTENQLANQQLKEELRTALLNRLPFILYARDMVRFYQLQKDHFSRRDDLNRFGIPLGYHVNVFYLFLWGMLEQFTLITKHAKDLEIADRDCGIRSPTFLQVLRGTDPALVRFLEMPLVKAWITIMADFRHMAAHKTIPMPTQFLARTEESQKSDEEILQILQRDDEFKEMLRMPWPADGKRWIEQQYIFNWRISKMRKVADHMVWIKGRNDEYARSPVMDIDHDLGRLFAVMDAFLVKLFNVSGSHASFQ